MRIAWPRTLTPKMSVIVLSFGLALRACVLVDIAAFRAL